MYLYDVQFQIWHLRVSTNSRLFKMQIIDRESCEFCGEPETIEHAFIWCERAIAFWSDLYFWLRNQGYSNFRLEHSKYF